MQSVINVVENALAASSEVLWDDVVNQLEPRERRVLHAVMRDLKRQGKAWRRVSVDTNGKSVLHIVKGTHPNLVG